MEAVETAIRAAMINLGGSLLEQLLAADTGHRGQWIDCGHGHDAVFVSYRSKIIDTALGPVTVRRAWYHCAECGHGLAPRDHELGAASVSMSPGVRKMTAKAAAVAPFAHAKDLLADLAGIELTTKRVERSAEADGQSAAATIKAEAEAIATGKVCLLPPPGLLPDTLYVAIDGTGVPMTPAETAGRAGKQADGKARTREVKLACLFTQTRVDDNRRPVRDEDSASYVATFDPAREFGTLMAAEAKRRGIDHIRQPVILGDGAAWIWNLAERYFPAATHIVDLYHAREHLHEIAAIVAFIHGGPDTTQHKEWLTDRLDDLDNGRIETLCNNTYDLPFTGVKTGERDKALAYFENNAARMQYRKFRDHGLFVGSGMVEADCKTIVGARLKQSGMQWTIPGATSILTLRCHHASDRFDQIWKRPHNQTNPA